MLEVAFDPYPAFADYTVWLSDIRRADMTPEELEEQHRRDRETYQRMRARMAADPIYREARLAVSRRATARWKERNGNRLDMKLRRLNRDRRRLATMRAELNARNRELYVGERAETIRARNRAWYARNRERRMGSHRSYYKQNLERLRAQQRVYNRRRYAADPAGRLQYNKAWRAQNIDRARAYVRVSSIKRRAASADAHFTFEEWLALLEKYERRCAYCGSLERIEADHRIPLCRGGANSIDNILPACRHCNRRKHQKTEDEFRALLERENRAN